MAAPKPDAGAIVRSGWQRLREVWRGKASHAPARLGGAGLRDRGAAGR